MGEGKGIPVHHEDEGDIVTFYSFKGGTGRTMALANTAWILASAGKRVLVVDWDLEAPGLHRFFEPFLDPEAIAGNLGVIDMITDYQRAVTRNTPSDEDRLSHYARVGPHVVPVVWAFPNGGSLDILLAGRQDAGYSALVASMNWDEFYKHQGGGQFFDAVRQDLRSEYEYTLIDSRTGLSDSALICTMQLPDILVTCFTFSNQGIDGAASFVAEIEKNTRKRPIRILPLPSRIDEGEKQKADTGRRLARSRFSQLPTGFGPDRLAEYWGSVEIPYRAFYAYEEILATFGDPPGVAASMLASFERFTGFLTDGAVTAYASVPEAERLRVLEAFTRKHEPDPTRVLLASAPEDGFWTEWIEATLKGAGATVLRFDRHPADSDAGTFDRIVCVASSAFLCSETYRMFVAGLERFGGANRLVVISASDVRASVPIPARQIFDLRGLSEDEAAEKLLRAMDLSATRVSDEQGHPNPRFPGNAPGVLLVPQRNQNFTGRNLVLDQLRRHLVVGKGAVALHGLAGVGKTQAAVEYVYRYQADYDLVWWVNAERPEEIVDSLSQLASRLGLAVAEAKAVAAADAVQELRRRGPGFRWLLVFDNVDEPEALKPFLPQGTPGHILVTSRNQAWTTIAEPQEVNVFDRAESVQLLTHRVTGLGHGDAERVAAALGDLPLAVDVAAAWLADTGTPVDDYLELLAVRTSVALSVSVAAEYGGPVQAWNVSLERLRQRSPAALRLLQLCSYMAPTISLTLIRSREMVEALGAHDPSVREQQLVVGQLIQEIGRLALAKVERRDNSLVIHRLVQGVIRDQMTDDEGDEARHTVHRVLVATWPDESDTDNPENWLRYDIIWPHLEPSQAMRCVEEPVRQLLIERVRYLGRNGIIDPALATANSLEASWRNAVENRLGPATVPAGEAALRRQLLSLRYEIANILRLRGEYPEARELDEQVLQEQTLIHGPTSPRTLMTARSLAADLRGMGLYREALAKDKATYETFKEVLGEEDLGTLMTANNLAISYRLIGDFATARDIDEATYLMRSEQLGDMHLHTLISAGHIARDMREAGEYELSAASLGSTLQSAQALGKTLPETLRIAVSLAVSLRLAGRIQAAKQLTEQTYELYVGKPESDMIDAYACLLNYAADLSAGGENLRAVDAARRVLVVYQQKYGAGHPYMLMCLNNLSIYERASGRVEEAARLARQAYDGLLLVMGDEHPYPMYAAVNLANALADTRRYEEALTLENAALGRLSDCLGRRHPDSLIAESNMSITLRAIGQTDEADARRHRVTASMAEKLGPSHPNTEAARQNRRISRDLEPQPT